MEGLNPFPLSMEFKCLGLFSFLALLLTNESFGQSGKRRYIARSRACLEFEYSAYFRLCDSNQNYCNFLTYILECENKIPTSCSVPNYLNTCSKIIEFGKEHGISVKEVCEVQWNEIAEHSDDVGSCTPATRGKIKDTCKVSCNEPCGGKYIKI